jgi:cell division protein FtsI (penicillin-binding protein 3)
MSLCFLSIGFKLITVALSSSEENIHFARTKIHRGEIVDRNGLSVAINLPGSSLFANPQKIIDPVEAADKLSKILPSIDKKKLLTEFKTNKSFMWIKRDLTINEKQLVHNLGIPGIYFEEEEKRVYTYGNLLSHLVGYVGRDNEGLAGLEKSYDKYLSDPNQPEPLKLTIDARIQSIVNEELDYSIEHFRAIAGFAIVVDPNTGEVIACVSKPDFNPHNPTKATADQLFNRYSLGVYEMGSGIKTINLAISLDSEKIAMNDAYDITSLRVANFNVKDTHPSKGYHTVPDIFLHSSNIGMAQMMLEVGQDEYKKYLERLGLFDKLDLDIPERGHPIMPHSRKWTDLDLSVMSYGYGFAMTPLHFTSITSAIVNGGYIYPTYFVKRDEEPIGRKVLKDSTSHDMKRLLRLVVAKGTGRKAAVDGYVVGGKTGTAEKRKGRRYDHNSRMTSFVAITPAHDPKYLVYVMLDQPQATKETFGFALAGWNAAPLAQRIIARMVALKGLSPYDENDQDIATQLDVEYEIEAET